MPADGIFPDEDEEPEVLHLTKDEQEAYNRSNRRSSTLTNEQAENPQILETAQRSAQRDERTATPQPNGSDRAQTLYESAKRHFDFNDKWHMKDRTILWCRPTFDFLYLNRFHWNDVRLAKNQCKSCENINRTKPEKADPIPCLISPSFRRCLFCFFYKRKGYECCVEERNVQNYSYDQHNSNYHYYDDYHEYTYGDRARDESYNPLNREQSRWYRDDYDRERERRDEIEQDSRRRQERTHRRERSPDRRPSLAKSVEEKANGIPQKMQKAERRDSAINDRSPDTPNPSTRQIRELEQQAVDLRNENSVLIKRCAGQLEDIQKLQEKHERSLEQKKDLEKRFEELEEEKNKGEQMLKELHSMMHAFQERMKQ